MVTKQILATIMSIAGLLYATKYVDQVRKIKRLGTSKGVSRTYFLKSVLYEVVCFICTLILLCMEVNTSTIVLLILTVFPLVGNTVTWIYAVMYAPISHKKSWKHWMYRKIKSLFR